MSFPLSMPIAGPLSYPIARYEGGGWWLSGSALDLDFAHSRAFNRSTGFNGSPNDILTYTSPSPKRVYGADGVLGYAPHNLLTYSEQFDNAAWTKAQCAITANAAVAPDGTTTMDKLLPDAGTGTNRFISQSAVGNCMTIYAKAAELSWLMLYSGVALSNAWFDLTNGVVGATSADVVSATIQHVGNGIYRCSVTWATISTVPRIYGVTGDGSLSVTTTGTEGILIWGAQANKGASALTYVPTTSAARYDLPIDHDPLTGEALGVLIEEQRTNQCLYSETLTNAAWSKTNSSYAADKLTEDTATGLHAISANVTITANTTQTITVRLKEAGRTKGRCFFGSSNGFQVDFNLATASVSGGAGVGTGTYTSASITSGADGEGYYTLTVTGLVDASTTACVFYVYLNNGSTVSYTGDGASGMYIRRVQVEAGAFATSYIQTGSAQVTRAADQVSILTSAFAWDAAAGTVLFTGYLPSEVDGTSGNYFYSISDGTTSNSMHVIDASTIRSQIVTAGVIQFDSSIGSEPVTGVPISAALGFAANDVRAARGGTLGALDTVATIPSGVNILRVGARADLFTVAYLNGHIARLTYWNTRKPDAELEELSA